jgi:hypothetical protein
MKKKGDRMIEERFEEKEERERERGSGKGASLLFWASERGSGWIDGRGEKFENVNCQNSTSSPLSLPHRCVRAWLVRTSLPRT